MTPPDTRGQARAVARNDAMRMSPAVLAKFMDRVARSLAGGCWIWTGSLNDQGYGRFRVGGAGTPMFRAHVVSYRHFVGPIPAGLELDHVRARGCKSKACVNPAHLEAVTTRANILRSDCPAAMNARKTECKRGHVLAGANVRINAKGERECVACKRQAGRDYQRRRRARPEAMT